MATDATEFVLRVLAGSESSLSGGDAGGGGGGASKQESDIKRELAKLNKTSSKGLGATLGIKLGTASILKQSQVFTGFIGTIFQLMGAMVDVILAPFLPVLIPAIRKMAELIPYMAKYAQAIFDFLDRTIFELMRGGIDKLLPDKFKNAIVPVLAALIVGMFFLRMTGLWGPFTKIVTNFIARPIWAAFKTFIAAPLWGAFKTLVARPIWGKLIRIFPYLDDMATFFKVGFFAAIKQIWDDALKSIGRPILKFLEDSFKMWKDDVVRIFVDPIKKALGELLTKIGNVLKSVDAFFGKPFSRLWAAISAPFKRAWQEAGEGLMSKFKSFYRVFVPEVLQKKVRSIYNFMLDVGDRFIKKPLASAVSYIGDMIRGLPAFLDNLMTRFTTWLMGLPIVGKIVAFLNKSLKSMLGKAGSLLKGAAGKLGLGKITAGAGMKGLKVLGMSLKGVPVIGAVAELGFGAYQTYQDYKKYGAKGAMARGALTLANTTAALFDPTGLASAAGSIGSNVALSYGMSKKFDVREDWALQNRELVVRLVTPSGEVRYIMKNNVDADNQVTLDQGVATARASMDANDQS